MRSFLTLIALATLTVPGLAQQRQTLPLNDGWRTQMVADLDSPPGDRWQTVNLPHTFSSSGYRAAWYENNFQVPPLPPGWRALLHFGGVKYNSQIWLNGTRIGGHFGGYDAFDVDATAALRSGQANLLRVGCRDWSGIFSPGPRVDIPHDFLAARGAPKDRLLAPIGGRFSDFGLWDRVALQYVPPVRVSHLSIRTLVRDRRLEVVCEVTDDSPADADVTCGGEVLDRDGKPVLALPAQTLHIAAGKTATTTLGAPAQLHCWSPDDPYLHTLQITLTGNGKQIDVCRERFGFRELWCDGPQFYLNGVPIILRASAAWPMNYRTKEEIATFWRQVKAANVIAFRTHTQPWPELYYETADEVGLLVIPEGAVWNDDCSYRINDPEFWRNYRINITSMLRNLGNHASVAMFSLENEMYGACQNEKNQYATEQLADLVRYAKTIAPVQPITLESDGDPLGSVDVFGLHYPWELPEVYAYPDAAYWMDKAIPRRSWYAVEPGDTWKWNRKKPLYIGEYLWCPDNTPATGTVFFGDDAYSSPLTYHYRAKAEAWRYQTEAYRYYRVSGLSPWTMVEGGRLNPTDNPLFAAERDAMAPLAAYPVEFNTRFFSGRAVVRHVRVFNDSFSAVHLQFDWRLEMAGRQPLTGEQTVDLAPCKFQEVEYRFTAPPVTVKTSGTLTLTLRNDGKTVFEQRTDCSTWPETALPAAPAGAVLFDPKGATARLLGASWKRIDSLAAIPAEATAVVIGDGAFQPPTDTTPVIGAENSAALALSRFLARGGRLLVLAQQAYPAGLFPVSLTDRNPTICFATCPDHPALRGLTSADLRWWAGDGEHRVAVDEPQRPIGGTALVVSGSRNGLATAPLIEYPAGPGLLLLSQLRLVEKADREPAARQLLANLIDYLGTQHPAPRLLRILAASQRVRDLAAQTRVSMADGQPDPGREIQLISGGATSELLNTAKQALAEGADLYLHRPTTAEIAAFLPKSVQLSLGPCAGPVQRVSTSPLAERLLREDLYWLDLHFSYTPLPAAGDIIDSALLATPDRAKATVTAAKALTPVGQIVEFRGDRVICATNGEAATNFDFGAGGWRLIGGSLGGTPAGGQLPVCEIHIDGVSKGSVTLTSGDFRDYAVPINAPPGKHRLSLAFVNDANIDGEDRNLYIRDLTVQPLQPQNEIETITSPAAVATWRSGGGRVLMDCLRWDDSPHASTRGLRAFADLLTGLGATFTVESASIVPGRAMQVSPARQWNFVRGSELYLGTTGGAEIKVWVAQAGHYAVDIVGWGTPVENEYPILRLLINGQNEGQTELRSDSFQAHRMGIIQLTRGEALLRIEFINDKQVDRADRNAYIDRIEFRRVGD